MVNSLFKEPIYQILEKIKNKPYFKWPNKMGGDPSKRNQSFYCHYHQEKGHTTEDCRTLRDHLDQLVKAGKLSQFLHQPIGQFGHSGVGYQRGGAPWLALGTINVIFAKPRGDAGTYLGSCLWLWALIQEIGIGHSKRPRWWPHPFWVFRRRIRREHSSHMMMSW